MAKREQRPTARKPRKSRGTRRKPAQPGGRRSAAEAVAVAGPVKEALSTFEAAMRTLQRHDYSGAAGQFAELLARFPRETALCDRARVYLELCERELGQQPPAPNTLEERLTSATAALNNDDDDEAERLAREVLAEAPNNDLALYLVAAVNARRGDSDAALETLRRAFAVSPDVGAQARHDSDFDVLRAVPEFQALVELSAPVDDGKIHGSRQPRR